MKALSKYKETPAMGVLPLCNWGGLVILDVDPCGQWIVSCLDVGEGRVQIKRSKIFFDCDSGRMFFRRFNTKYYLDEVMRA